MNALSSYNYVILHPTMSVGPHRNQFCSISLIRYVEIARPQLEVFCEHFTNANCWCHWSPQIFLLIILMRLVKKTIHPSVTRKYNLFMIQHWRYSRFKKHKFVTLQISTYGLGGSHSYSKVDIYVALTTLTRVLTNTITLFGKHDISSADLIFVGFQPATFQQIRTCLAFAWLTHRSTLHPLL